MPKPDKYDETTRRVMRLCEQHEPYSFVFEEVRDELRSAFPETPPAEDTRELAVRIVGTSVQEFSRKKSIEEYAWKAAAEIESFARSRVKPWREALERWEQFREAFEDLTYHHEGMGCGIEDRGITDRYAACEYGWDKAMARVAEHVPESNDVLLSADDAKEARHG